MVMKPKGEGPTSLFDLGPKKLSKVNLKKKITSPIHLLFSLSSEFRGK